MGRVYRNTDRVPEPALHHYMDTTYYEPEVAGTSPQAHYLLLASN